MKQKQFKRCPRCDKKTPIFQDRCEGCGLVFSRLSKATNSAAKKNIKNKEYNKVIMDKVLPRDVDKWKLFFIALFFGFFGVHYAKVGRYKMFTYGVVSAASIYIAALLPQSWFYHQYLFFLMWALVLPASVYAIIYVVSLFSIITNKFKVPISIDEELVTESLDKNIVDDVLKVAKNNNEENIVNNEKVLKNKNQVKAQPQKEASNEAKEKKIKNKHKKVSVVCSSCGQTVRVFEDENICPKCDEPLREE